MLAKNSEQEAESANAHLSFFNAQVFFFGFWLWISVLLVAYYLPSLSGRADFYVADTSYFFEPFSRFAGNEIRHGHLPLWNPLIYCGMSQSAVPSPSIFYLPSYLLFLLPFSQGLSFYMIFHQALFALGAYFYAREHKLSRQAALLAAVSAGLMSYCFALTRNPTLPATAAWIPAALFLQKKIRLNGGPIQLVWLLSLASSVAMIIGAGRPEIFLPGLSILFIDGSLLPLSRFFLKRQFDRQTKRAFVCILAIISGLALAGPQILPALEWTALSARSHGLDANSVFAWSANWFDFLCLVYSHPMGNVCGDLTTEGTIMGNLVLSKHMALPILTSAYVGPITISFAVFAFFNKSWKKRYVFLAFLLFSCILSAGNFTPVAPFLLKLAPVFAIIRYPIKLFVFPVMILICAGAVGFDLSLKKQISTRLMQVLLVVWLIPTLVSLLVIVCPSFYLIGYQYLSDSFYAPIVREANLRLATSLAAGGLLGLALVSAAYLLHKDKIKVQIFYTFTLIALSLSLFCSANTYPYLTKSGFYTARSKLFDYLDSFLAHDAVNGVKGRILPLYQIETGMRVPLEYKRNSNLTAAERFFSYARSLGVSNTTVDFALAQSYGYEAAVTEKYDSFFRDIKEYGTNFLDGSNHPKPISDRPLYRFCLLTATQYVMTQESLVSADIPLPELDDRYFELFGRSSGNNSRIYKVIKPHSRIFFADNIELVDSWTALKQKLCNPEPIAADRNNVVYLLKTAETEASVRAISQESGAAGSRRFSLDRDEAQSLRLRTEADKPALLVISDQDYPGWTAEIDGKPAGIINANLFARALFVPSGRHVLSFHFMPAGVIGGLCTAAIALALLLFVYFICLKQLQVKEPDGPG